MSGPVKPVSTADYCIERYGILNPEGQFWTPDTFSTEARAEEHIRAFWKGSAADDFLRRAKIIPVTVTVSDARPSPERTPHAL